MKIKFTNLQRILNVFEKIVTLNTHRLQNIIFYDVEKQNATVGMFLSNYKFYHIKQYTLMCISEK